MAVCGRCHGTGQVYDSKKDGMAPCPDCNGLGMKGMIAS